MQSTPPGHPPNGAGIHDTGMFFLLPAGLRIISESLSHAADCVQFLDSSGRSLHLTLGFVHLSTGTGRGMSQRLQGVPSRQGFSGSVAILLLTC